MDTELFMECEEEELEPWQQVDDSVEEDEMDFDNYSEPGDTHACARTHTHTVMNRGTPLLFNLQPGQTVQPLTLIQCKTRPLHRIIINPSGGPAQPGSAFTAMQLPATLTIRTSTPGPGPYTRHTGTRMTQVCGANSLKLAGSPALPSGSANGVTRVTTFSSNLTTGSAEFTWSQPSHSAESMLCAHINRFSVSPGPAAPGPAPSVVTTPSVTAAPLADPPRVVMSVEEFYYGTFEGDLSLRKPHPLGIKTTTFNCQICSHLAENNLRLMQHMLQHSELIGGGGGDERKCCRFCYRQFSSPAQLQTHQEQVHGSTLSSSMCRICEWAFENEPAFLNHMKSNHKPGEMPYICQVCSYRSSFYSDILQHFASFHRDSRFLLCVFCLKVTRNPTNYQQHLLRHQINQAFHCNRCRLQFVFLKDKMQHKLENHRSFRRPAQLEGLPPGSKVRGRLLQTPSSLVQQSRTRLRRPIRHRRLCHTFIRVPARLLQDFTVRRRSLRVFECGTDASDFSAHYPTHVHCLLCPYSSCCSRAYAAHMIHVFLLQCSHCDFRPQTADQMAAHLLKLFSCFFSAYIEPDIQFCQDDEQRSPEEKEAGQNKDLPDPSWRSAEGWKQPAESDGTMSDIIPFMQSSGPRNFLSKNSDAIDFFNLLFPAELVELITNETNAHAKTCQFLGSCHPDWVPVTTHEIKGFIGLVVLMGIQNLPDPSHYWSWSHYDNSYTFYRAMSFKRFKQIAANVRMGSFTTDEFRGTNNPSDSLHIFRPMLDIVGGAMWNAYRPNCCLTIDRALLPSLEEESGQTKGNPKTQPQVWLLCDSKSGYCHRFFIQVGEQMGQEPGFTVVPELMKGLEDKHHQLYLASSLTSVPLMQKLLDQGIYASSSFPPQNPILPRQLWEEGQLEKPGDFLQRQFGPLMATRWRDTKEMGCLSTNAAPGEMDTVWRRSQTKVGGLDPIDRPMAFRLLQENMRGVDICKQLLACNPLGGILQDRHWRSVFWFLVNLSIVNAFIVLRESRKDNPPAWVQDGLFTQVNFRKRLGNQLAKCAQKYFETMEIASSRGMRVEVADEPVKQRHRMAKISAISKRCKNCNMKSIRHESVYGCITCKANLCKQPSCFWEYHGLSPLNKGPTKVGFLKDRISGAVEVDEVEDNMDERMDDLDDIDEGSEDLKDEFIKEVKHPTSHPPSTKNSHTQPVAILPASKERDDFLTARQLRIALFALCDGLRQASRVFSTEAQLIRKWLKEAKRRLKRTEAEHQVHGEDRMVAWVLSMREQQLPITESNLFHKASTLKKKGGFSDSFRISYDWAVSFMLQHRLGVRSIGTAATLTRTLPASLEAKVKSFREFTQKIIQVHKLSENAVAAMDELCLFVDLRLVQDKCRRSEALELTGSLPLVTVYLTVLADGTMLPSLVLANRQLAEKVLPKFILLEAGPESLLVEEALDLWTNKVWLQHTSGLTQPSKSMLVSDRHREHMGDQFLTSISGSGTLPAVIPGGCAFCLQPLEVCVKPALQRFILLRWAKFTAGNPKELEETSPHRLQANVAQLLVDWVVEALTHLNKVPQLWRKSFRLSGLLLKEEVEEEAMTSQKPEGIQLDLLKTLSEALLGAEALEAFSPDMLELEDEDDSKEEQEGGRGQETSEETQEDKEETEKEVKEDKKETEEKGKKTEEEGRCSHVSRRDELDLKAGIT
uniref:Pogo transposable element derived with ZNF domain b n=1 Tax=Seriola lalandi dorsalis TaxID=1841481 RepID=A0A3B4WD52_SERLL